MDKKPNNANFKIDFFIIIIFLKFIGKSNILIEYVQIKLTKLLYMSFFVYFCTDFIYF